MTKPVIKTFALYGGAYSSTTALNASVTHACEVNEEGFPRRVLCGKVPRASICEDPTQATDEEPTCQTCAKRKAKAEGIK